MIISRISLIGEPDVTVHIPRGNSGTVGGLLVITGPNGSGKSLLTLALETALVEDDARTDLAAAVHSAGVERIEVDFEYRGWAGQISVPLPDGTRSIVWEKIHPEAIGRDGGPDAEEQPDRLPLSELFSGVHLVRSGRLAVPDFGRMQSAVLNAKREPLQEELSRWNKVEMELAGEDGEGGRLCKVREAWAHATGEAERVQNLAEELENARRRQQDITIRINDAAAQRDILNAEADELGKACILADRAMRLDNWIAEIRQESKTVQRLREQHAELQEKLDGLERRFRGTTEQFPALLDEYQTLVRRERDLHEKSLEAHSNVDRLKREMQDLDLQLLKLSAPQLEDLVTRRDGLGRDIEKINVQITEVLRGRIELVRQREGLEQLLHRKYQAFVDLDPELRAELNDFFARGEQESNVTVQEKTATVNVAPLEARLAALQMKLRERFQGFELLPDSTPGMLKELFDQRHAFGTLSSDLEGLRARSANLRGKMRQSRSVVWSVVAAAVGFGAGTAMFAWDIGLFVGLVASLITMLAFQYSHRRIESEIESAVSAEAMTQRRYDAVRDSMTRLERALKPIAHIPNLDDALVRLEEFKSLMREFQDVESSLTEARTELLASPVVEMTPLALPLIPEPLAHIPIPVLRQLHSEFVVLEQQLADLSEAWRDYADGGAQAAQIRSFEDRIARLHEEQSQLAAEIERRNQIYLSQHNDLLGHRSALEEALNVVEDAIGSEGELTGIQDRLNTLDKESGGLLRSADLDVLRTEWREREGLRAQLREIKDSLSAKQTHDELRAREALLTEELAQVKHRLLDLDPLYMLQGTAADYASKYAGQLQRLREDITTAEEQIRVLQTEIGNLHLPEREATFATEQPIEELQEAVADARERLEVVERELHSVRERIKALQENLDEIDASVGFDLREAINNQVRTFTADRLNGVNFRDGQWHAVAPDGTSRALSNLSEGTSDLICLAIRTAVLEFLQDLDDWPVVWDEALSRLDEHHLTNVRVALVKLCTRRQVLLLSRQTDLEWWGQSVKLPAAQKSAFNV